MPSKYSEQVADPEDILSTSLQTLYAYQPVVFSEAGSTFTYTSPEESAATVTVLTPDTHAKNWALHVSSIWISSIYMADHISELKLAFYLQQSHNNHTSPSKRFEILELGAGAGLPGILIAKHFAEHTAGISSSWRVTLSDYPDAKLIDTLNQNVRRNISNESLEGACVVKPYAWRDDPSSLLFDTRSDNTSSSMNLGFDLIFAADTLWNPDLHNPFYSALCALLRKSPDARVHLVAGLHTGPYTIEGFLGIAKNGEICIESVLEREVNGVGTRDWIVDRDDRDEVEKRRWIVWIILKWRTIQ